MIALIITAEKYIDPTGGSPTVELIYGLYIEFKLEKLPHTDYHLYL